VQKVEKYAPNSNELLASLSKWLLSIQPDDEEEFMSYCDQGKLFTFEDFFSKGDDNHRLVLVLSSLEDDGLICKLQRERNGRRDQYPVRMLWQSLIAAKVYGITTVNSLIRELNRNESLRRVVGIEHAGLVPKPWHFSRLLSKLSKPENLALLKGIFDTAVGDLSNILPDLGESLAIDGTEVSSWCNRYAKDKSDKDAGWGVKTYRKEDGTEHKHSWYGYNVELLVDTKYEIPVNFEVLAANINECPRLPILLGDTMRLHPSFDVKYVMGDRGYDSKENCRYVLYDLEALPIIKMRLRQSDKDAPFAAEICRCTELGTPICDCGEKMVYAGRDGKYLKFRCPRHTKAMGGPCSTSRYGRVLKVAISENERRWPGLHRESKKFKRLYRRRTSVERVNSRLKEHLCLDEQHVRGLAKTTVNVGLSLLVMVGWALSMARNKQMDNLRQIVALAA
jgi:transposase